MNKSKVNFWTILFIAVIIYFGFGIINKVNKKIIDHFDKNDKYVYSDSVFSLITTPENKIMEDTIKTYLTKKGYDVEIVYADNLDIVDKLNGGEKYDAIWASNSIWLDNLNNISTSDSKSTSITPITFGIKKSKAEKLGLVNKNVKMSDILTLIKNKELTFSMANPINTNSGASSYLNILTTLAGNPDVLTSKDLNNNKLKEDMKSFFQGLARTSGDEDFLEKSFINGDYDAAFTYESSIININKELEKQKKETLYAIYPVDGVVVCDSPLVYINNHNDDKKEAFLTLQEYILSGEGQDILLHNGRRTWYGGTTNSAPADTFKKEWGIDTTKYISPLKYPNQSVIKEALKMYVEELRKPVHVVFCLDYSGSMYGDGYASLVNAMDYIFTDKATANMINFTEKDKVDVLAFGSNVHKIGSEKGNNTGKLLEKIREYEVNGATALYPSAIEALKLLKDENDNYNTSIILMTDGDGNIGTFKELENTYHQINKDIPIYSITFGYANEEQLNKMASLSNGKVFDGKTNLTEAFKTVRGYN